jgi:hypothetical protein
MPLGTKTVTIHTIVDHEIVETIANNRTAMATYHEVPSAASTEVVIIGAGAGVKASIRSWVLEAANNRGPQPEERPGVVQAGAATSIHVS